MNVRPRTGMLALWPLLTALLLASISPVEARVGAGRPPAQPGAQPGDPGWTLITASQAQFEDHFGFAAALDGDVLAVSAPGTALPGEGEGAGEEGVSAGRLAGAVHLYQRQGQEWGEAVTLTAPDAQPGDQFGLRLALSGATLAVAAPYKRVSPAGSAAGAVYVFHRQGETWSQQALLTAPDGAPFDLFGSALALEGDTLAVGARSADLPGKPNAGAVYVFQRQEESWSLQSRLAPEDAGDLDYFGQELALFEDELLVGAPGRDGVTGGDNTGTVYHFRRRGDDWRQAGRIDPPDPQPNAQFGWALGLNEQTGTLAVYAQTSRSNLEPEPGMETFLPRENYFASAYVFERSRSGWDYEGRLVPEHSQDIILYFLPSARVAVGGSSLSGETVVVSMGLFYGNFIFQRQGDRWQEVALPDRLYESLGFHPRVFLQAVAEDRLLFSTVDVSSEVGPGILLFDLSELGVLP